MNSIPGKTSDIKPRPQVPFVLVTIAVVALILFVIWRGWMAFSGPVAGKLPPPPTQDIHFIQQKAKECQGDFKKLSVQDQERVQQISHGFGEASMASTYRELSKPSP